MNKQSISVDIAIFGGGIAGLWTLNRLRALGFKCVLFESHTLGNGQTIKSQGIIHGGIKYALTGFLSKSAHAIESMPKRWKNCLQGTGEIDLSSVKVLSNDQLLWSTGKLTSEITSFFASLALNSRVKKLPQSQHPEILKNPLFKGQVYRLDEVVLDPHSLVDVLAKPHLDHIFKINSQTATQFSFEPQDPKHITSVTVSSGSETVQLHAKHYIFAAGAGNEALTSHFVKPPKMQRRPLQMVMVKLDKELPFYAHCIDHGINPRITITSQPTRDHKTLWYLGGQIAESGAELSPALQIAAAQKELMALFPWLELTHATWGSFYIDRAEPQQPDGKRPDTAFIESIGNASVVWPTKLALAPLLTDKIVAHLAQQKITPRKENSILEMDHFEKPTIALPLEDILLTCVHEE